MGLNDLTLEKLIGEINGYKEKMRAIHEDYGRASQELQDRINVLGYNLNEHLKETKDQIASTPQRLLTLETKYVTGEVNDGEYRQQREEFKGLLERNLHSIEEIRAMIATLSHIEARPLTPSEFKQAAAPRTGPSADWNRPSAATESTPLLTPPQQNPTVTATPQTALRFTPEPTSPTPSIPAYIAAPSGQQPTPTSIPNPQSANAPETEPTPQDRVVGPIFPMSPAPVAVATTDLGLIIDSPASEPIEASIDEATQTIPTVDIVETTGADEALMVKVVDDIPSVDASSVVVTDDSSALQPTIGTTDASAGIPSVASDLATVSLTPPTQFYKVVCPKCGADVPKPVKVWELKGGKSKKNVLIGLFQCQDCRVKFREALTREII